MKQQIKISVIVPAYNVEPYIEKTLESICAQTYQNLEIIVVDDGSTDGTREVIERVKSRDNRIKAIYKGNEGVTKTRLRGVQEASGEWIGFVDADDYVTPEMYEKLLSLVYEYSADIAHCGYKMDFGKRQLLYYGTHNLIIQGNEQGVYDLVSGEFIEPSLCTKLFKAEIVKKFEQSGEMDSSIRNMEDLLMNFYLFRESKKSVFLDECYYDYLVREGSATTSRIDPKKIFEPLYVFRWICEKVKMYDSVFAVCEKRLVNQLIRISTLKMKKGEFLYEPWMEVRKELNARLPSILKGEYDLKTKILACLAAKCAPLYRLIYSIYLKIKKPNDKYKIER